MKRDYFGILLEEIRDQNKPVLEAVGAIQETIKTLATKAELQKVSDQVTAIKYALTETNKGLRGLSAKVTKIDTRVARLEDRLPAAV